MPYKRPNSPNYYIWLRGLPAYPPVRMSTGVSSKKVARDMERLLRDLAQRALMDPTWYDLLDAVCQERKIDLPKLLKAKHQDKLTSLKRSLHDPLLTDAVTTFEKTVTRRRGVLLGLDMLREYAGKVLGPKARLGDLTGKAITKMCRAAETDPEANGGEGRKRNSVRRTMLRAISLLLRHEIGNTGRNEIFEDVIFPAEDDTREVHLTPSEIGRLLKACTDLGYHELTTVIRLALQTSADRGVLLAGMSASKECRGLLVSDVKIWQRNGAGSYVGKVYLHDSKTDKRSRTVPITDRLCRELLVLMDGKEADEPVFNLTYAQLDYPWKEVRKAGNLKRIRFKDLRAQVSQYGEEAGVPQTVLTKTMGHSDEAMTRRYQQRAAVMSPEQAEAIEAAMYSRENGELGKTG